MKTEKYRRKASPSINNSRPRNISFNEHGSGVPVLSKFQNPYTNAQHIQNRANSRTVMTHKSKTNRLNETITSIFKGIAENKPIIIQPPILNNSALDNSNKNIKHNNEITKEVTIKLSELLDENEDCNVGDIDDHHHYQFAWDIYDN